MEISAYMRFIAALLFVLALIGGLTWLARRFGLVVRVTPGRSPSAKRLSITEVHNVDARRRLLLVRRDNVEHLVLLGTEKDLLIESGIDASDKKNTGPEISPSKGSTPQ